MNKKKRRVAVLLSATIGSAVLVLSGCSGKSDQTEKTLRVGVITYTQDDPFINGLTDELKAQLKAMENKERRIIVSIKSGNDDPLRPALNLEELEKNPPAEKLPAWIKTLSDVRKKHPAARTGRYRELMLTNRQYAFARLDETDALITAVNNDENQSAGVWIPASCDGTWKNAVTGEAISPENGKLFVEVPPCGCVLIEKES